MTSRKVKFDGSNIPLRATSIIPLDVTAPTMIPSETTVIIMRIGAAFDAMAELRKLAASFITPIKSPATAITTITASMNV